MRERKENDDVKESKFSLRSLDWLILRLSCMRSKAGKTLPRNKNTRVYRIDSRATLVNNQSNYKRV